MLTGTETFQKGKRMKKQQCVIKMKKGCGLVAAMTFGMLVVSETLYVNAAEKFDPAFYAVTYADVVQVLGTDSQTMYEHYLTYGQKEGRKAYPSAMGGEAVEGIVDTIMTDADPAQTASAGLVPLEQLPHLKNLKKKCTDEEFRAAYDVAAGIVTPLTAMGREDQLYQIAAAIRYRVDSGQVYYSTDEPHYNDPYGYFVAGVASCAGCARATGLCLDMLGIPYEHVNENQWSHQWCRVNMGDSYWICDAYGLYVGAEPFPYGHPLTMD